MVAPPLNGPYRGRKPHSGPGGAVSGGLSSWSWLGIGLAIFGLSFHLYTQYLWLTPPVADGRKGTLSLGTSGGLMSLGSGAADDVEVPPLFIVGTHHKTGTALMALILREAQVVHKSLTGRSTGIMMGYFGNPLMANAPFSFYYCDALYTNNWNKSHNATGEAVDDTVPTDNVFAPSCPPPLRCTADHLPKLVDHHHFFQGRFDFVHLVRDPMELVVSAYLYHHSGPPQYQEPWLYDMHPVSNYETVLKDSTCDASKYTEMSWYDVLQCLNEKEGVLAEALFQTYFGALPSIISSTKHVHHKHGARVLQMGLEEFSDNFDAAVHRLFTFFKLEPSEVEKIVRSCSQYDLKRQSWSERQSNKHVTVGKHDRNLLRNYVLEFGEKDAVFREARELLGYPKKKVEAGDSAHSSEGEKQQGKVDLSRSFRLPG